MAGLQSRLDEFKKAFESGAPRYNAPHEVIETMHRARAELRASGLENTARKVGDRAPEFALFNQDHVKVNSADLLRQGPIVVSFFRRALVTLLHDGAGSSTGNRFRGQGTRSADRGAHS
jgi:hypothetical protein